MSMIAEKVKEYDELRTQKKVIEEQMKKLSADIQKYAEAKGVKDEKGSYYIDNDDYVFGKTAKKSVKLNQEKALAYCKNNEMGDCIDVVETVNEDKLAHYVSIGEITSKTLEDLTDIKITYAVSVTKKESEEDMPEIQQTKAEKAVKSPVFKRRR